MSDSMWPYGQQPTRLLCPQDSLGKNTGVGCHFLLQASQLGREICKWMSFPWIVEGVRDGERLFCKEKAQSWLWSWLLWPTDLFCLPTKWGCVRWSVGVSYSAQVCEAIREWHHASRRLRKQCGQYLISSQYYLKLKKT